MCMWLIAQVISGIISEKLSHLIILEKLKAYSSLAKYYNYISTQPDVAPVIFSRQILA